MAFDRRTTFRSLIESRDGYHLSVYLENHGVAGLRAELRASIASTEAFLEPVLGRQELESFLEPLNALYRDRAALSAFPGNVALFRTPSLFHAFGLPVDLETTCVVASSFHVKPLLRWMQMDRDFLLLGLERDAASLHLGNQQEFRHLETLALPPIRQPGRIAQNPACLDHRRALRLRWEETSSWLATWAAKLHLAPDARLFLAGERRLTESFSGALARESLPATALPLPYRFRTAEWVCAEVRSLLQSEAALKLRNSIAEFYHAEEMNLAHRNIFHIAKAAVRGNVRKLIVADGINIFGKLDRRTGGLAIHPTDLDHEDDCLLDDLAQTVLERGGEVLVARRDEIPKGQPILAILDKPGLDASTALGARGSLEPLYERRCL